MPHSKGGGGKRQLFRGPEWRVSSLDWTRRRIGAIRGSDSNIQNSKRLTWPTERKRTPMEIYKWWRSSLSAASRCCTGHYYPPAAPICCQPSRDLPVRGYKPRHHKHRLGSCYHLRIWGQFPKRLERPAGSLLPLTLNLLAGRRTAKSWPYPKCLKIKVGYTSFLFFLRFFIAWPSLYFIILFWRSPSFNCQFFPNFYSPLAKGVWSRRIITPHFPVIVHRFFLFSWRVLSHFTTVKNLYPEKENKGRKRK